MSFGNPQGLWLLALGVPILAFHFYRGRVRRLAVPTLHFWERVLVEEERRTALKRLRHHASLLLNLSALVLLVSAVAEPEVEGIARPRSRYALIVDSTASMGALEPDGRTRLAHAVDRAREFARSLGRGDEVALHDLSGLVAPFSADLERAARAIAPPPPARAPASLRARLLAALAAGVDVTAVFFTDRPPGGAEDLLASGRLRWVRIGTPRENSGWVSGLAVRRAGERRAELSLALENFGAAAVERTEVLSWNGREVARRPLKAGPGERVEARWLLEPALFPAAKVEEGGLASVALDPPDALPLDDAASFVLPPLVPPPVVVFHPGKPDDFLMQALHALKERGHAGPPEAAAVELYPRLRDLWGEGSVAVFDRCAPPGPLGRGAFFLVGAGGAGWVERPAIADWDREAPPNRLVDYSAVALRRSRILQGRPLLRAAEGPVATWSAGGGRATVELGFGLEDTDLKLLPPFLMLLQNFVEWAAFEATRSFRTDYAVGEPLRPEKPLWLEEGELLFARGDSLDRAAVRKGRLLAPPRAGPGLVRAGAEGRSEWLAVNLFDAAESDLREPGAGAAGRPLPPPAPWHARIPYAPLAAAAVVAILLVEGWLYHRGLI